MGKKQVFQLEAHDFTGEPVFIFRELHKRYALLKRELLEAIVNQHPFIYSVSEGDVVTIAIPYEILKNYTWVLVRDAHYR